MKCKIIIEKLVLKFLENHKEIAYRFFEKAEIMEVDLLSWLLDIKKMKWTSDRYRLRIGKYRFLFRKTDWIIIIYFYDADSRGDIYK